MTCTLPIPEWIRLLEVVACEDALPKNIYRTKVGCKGKLMFHSMLHEGGYVVVRMQCQSCGEGICFGNSNRKCVGKGPRGMREANLKTIASTLLLERGSYRTHKRGLRLEKISKGGWETGEKKVWKASNWVAKGEYENYTRELKKKKRVIIMCGDGSWSQRRNARHGCYTITDMETKKVIYQVHECF
jgi:hypothetical protein